MVHRHASTSAAFTALMRLAQLFQTITPCGEGAESGAGTWCCCGEGAVVQQESCCGEGAVVARGLAPVRLRSSRKTVARGMSDTTLGVQVWGGLLRSPTGASPLATTLGITAPSPQLVLRSNRNIHSTITDPFQKVGN